MTFRSARGIERRDIHGGVIHNGDQKMSAIRKKPRKRKPPLSWFRWKRLESGGGASGRPRRDKYARPVGANRITPSRHVAPIGTPCNRNPVGEHT